MPPLTPRRMRAISGPRRPRAGLGAVVVVDLPAGQLLERDRQVVARRRVDHRRREFLVAALAKGAVIAVQLPGALRGHHHGGVVRIGPLQELVYAWLDHVSLSSTA